MSFDQWLVDHEPQIRITFFFGIFVVMAIWEIKYPRRQLIVSKVTRWINNISLVVLNSVLLRFIFPTLAVGVSVFATEQQWGILNHYSLPFVLSVFISFVFLDLIIYLQHVLVHAVPALWRLHRVHHSDKDYDLTTGARFHPIEIIISMLIKFSAIIVIGAPVVAVIIFEVVLNTMAMFNHANVKLPTSIDGKIRKLLVTPDMHRVHHSIEDDETNSNFGFNLSIWDRLFGTYRNQPRAGHEDMIIGIRTFTDNKDVVSLPGLLMLPFKGKISDYAINRRTWSEKDIATHKKNAMHNEDSSKDDQTDHRR